MADRGLGLAEPVTEGRDVQFAFPHEVHQDLEASLIRQELEDLDQILFQLGGKVRGGSHGAGLDARGIHQGRSHVVLFLVLVRKWVGRAGKVIRTFGSLGVFRVLRLGIEQRLDLRLFKVTRTSIRKLGEPNTDVPWAVPRAGVPVELGSVGWNQVVETG